MTPPPAGGWPAAGGERVVVSVTPSRRAASERALVLRAKGIGFQQRQGPEGFALLVSPLDAELAARELELYERENRGWPPYYPPLPLVSGAGLAAVGWVALLFVMHSITRAPLAGLPWYEAGASVPELVKSGQVWRAVTALTLHSGVPHLLSNAVFGALFFALLAQLYGFGLASLVALVSGTIGNLLNAWIRTSPNPSIGASTAVFALIGALVACQWLRLGRAAGRRRWVPIVMGLVFLGYLGTSGERTDVLAHVTGLVAGFGVGVIVPIPLPDAMITRARQVSLLLWTLGALVLAWSVALASAG